MGVERSMRTGVALVATLMLASGCQLARMQVDPALATVNAMPVQGYGPHKADQPISFGNWTTSAVHEGWTYTRRLWVIDRENREVASYDKMRRPFGFEMDTRHGLTQVQCVIRGKATAVKGWQADLGMLKQIPPLECDYIGPVDGHLRLLQQVTLETSEEGEMEFASTRWHVSSVSHLENSRFASGDIVGYEIRRDREIVGAVEAINHGRVWISPHLTPEEQDRVAVLASSLLHYRLVYEPIEPRDDHDYLN